ncbi:MAG: hypothetical protein RR667_06930 [Muribaculaceae bacterium]
MSEVREGYKMTELGEIPSEWEVRQLKEVSDKTDRYGFAGGPFGSDLTSKRYLMASDSIRLKIDKINHDTKYIMYSIN